MLKKGVLLVPLALGVSALGFLFQILLVRRFGLTAEVDGYYYSLSWPIFVSGMLAASVNMRFTPEFRRMAISDGHLMRISSTEFRRAVARALVFTLVLAGPCMAFQYLSAPAVLFLGAARALPISILLAWVLGMLLVTLSVCVAAITAQARPFLANAMNLASPVAGVLTLLIFEPSNISILLLSQSVGLVGAIAVAVMVIRKVDQPATGTAMLNIAAVDFSYSVLAGLAFTAYPVIDAYLASFMPVGGLTALALVQRLIIGLSGLVLVIPMAYLGAHCTDVYVGSRADFYLGYVRKTVFISILAFSLFAISVYLLRHNLFEFLADVGRLSSEGYRIIDELTSWMLVGMVAMMLGNILHRCIYATGGRHPFLAAVGVMWAFIYLVTSYMNLDGGSARPIAVAYSIAWCLSSAVMTWYLCMSGMVSRHKRVGARC